MSANPTAPARAMVDPDVERAAQHRCQALACAIQTCLARNDYNHDKCERVIQTWKECYDKALAEATEAAIDYGYLPRT